MKGHQSCSVDKIADAAPSQGWFEQYQREIYKRQGALPPPEADRLICESEHAFLRNLGRIELGAMETEANPEQRHADQEFFE